MATKLEKDVVRDCKVLIKDKEVVITLTKEQEISMKLKGSRKSVSISIDRLFRELSGMEIPKSDSSESNKSVVITPEEKKDKNVKISLFDLRSHNAISMLDLDTKCKFDQIIKSLITSPTFKNE